VLFHIAGPPNLRLAEVRQAADEIRAAADPGADVIFGATVDKRFRDDVQVTLIATGKGDEPGPGSVAVAASETVPGMTAADAESLEVPTFIRSRSRTRPQGDQAQPEA
jgi:cell division protein FtsZ